MKSLILILLVTFANSAFADYNSIKNSVTATKNERLAISKNKDQNRVNTMYYFIKHIDEDNTIEKIKLTAYLTGLKAGFSINYSMEKKRFNRPWSCMSTKPFYGKRGDAYVIDMLKWVYKTYPDRFSKGVGIYSPTSDALAFGIQVNNQCHATPQIHITGYNYSYLPTKNGY